MGHTTVPDQNNALYGYKGDLKETLTDRRLPRWLKSSPIHVTALHRDISVEEAFEKAAKEARRRRQEYDMDNPTWSVEFVFDTGSSVIPRSRRRNPVPDRIWGKLNITTEDAQEYTGFHHVSPREYRLKVDVGPRGGIDDLQIVRDFHH